MRPLKFAQQYDYTLQPIVLVITNSQIQDISARSGSCITSLTSDQVAGNIFVAGFGDGAVRVFDQRLKPTTAMVKVWREHKQWITNVHMQRGGVRELVSGSRNGEVRLWDLRMDHSIESTQATKDTLRTLGVHEHAPVFTMYVCPYLINFFGAKLICVLLAEPIAVKSRHSMLTALIYLPSNLIAAFCTIPDPPQSSALYSILIKCSWLARL